MSVERPQVLAQWREPADAVLDTARRTQERGGVSFEHGYGPPEGVEWPADYQPGPDDDVLWYAEAVLRRKLHGHRPTETTYRGTALVKAGANHGRGVAYACIDLLEQMGDNVVVLDYADDEEEKP